MSKNNLDEMQLQRRNKIGNQVLIILFYLLMIDIALYGFGFRWLNYPVNVFVIMQACMGYYLIRIIWGNAYIGPQIAGTATWKKWVILIVATGAVAAAVVLLSQKDTIKISNEAGNDNGALVLLIISVISLLMALVITLVKNKQNKKNDE